MYKAALPRKEKIIITAIDLLDEVGIGGLTTKAIAQRQHITEAAIYKHFDSKKDIIIAILKRYAIFDQSIRNTIIENKIRGKSAILYYVKAYAEYYQNYPQITTPMFSFDIYRYDEDTNNMMKTIVKDRYDLISQAVLQGVELGEILARPNYQGLSDAVFGMVWTTTLLWKLNQCSFDLKKRLLTSVDVLVSG